MAPSRIGDRSIGLEDRRTKWAIGLIRGEMNAEEKTAVIDDAMNSRSSYLLELHYSPGSARVLPLISSDFDLAIVDFAIPRQCSCLRLLRAFVNYDPAIAPNESTTISSIIDIRFIRSREKENFGSAAQKDSGKERIQFSIFTIFARVFVRRNETCLGLLSRTKRLSHEETSVVCVIRYRGNLISSDNLSFAYRLHLSAFISSRIARFQKCTRALTR